MSQDSKRTLFTRTNLYLGNFEELIRNLGPNLTRRSVYYEQHLLLQPELVVHGSCGSDLHPDV